MDKKFHIPKPIQKYVPILFSQFDFLIDEQNDTSINISNSFCKIRFTASYRDFDLYGYISRKDETNWLNLNHIFERINSDYSKLIHKRPDCHDFQNLFKIILTEYNTLLGYLGVNILNGDLQILYDVEKYYELSAKARRITFANLPTIHGFVIPELSNKNWKSILLDFLENSNY
jgi:hypothetical protein